jgi:predicted anti-sigma-YlaC factor YlaD
MLSCKQASQLVSQSLERPLNRQERFALRMHLWICRYCRRFSQQLHALRVILRRRVQQIENDTQITLPAETKQGITNLINRQQ